jgi:methylated-DNA-[protein]-cysteine S-methyltransferase
MNSHFHTYLDFFCGYLKISGDSHGLASISFTEKPEKIETTCPASLREPLKQLTEYLAKKRQKFSLKLNLRGTDFQKKVWQELLEMPYGQTVSYEKIAQNIGCPKAVRAVGTAIGKNPIGIIIPCHRVIRKNGSLGGYAGGLKRKEWLLAHEKKDI